MPYIRWDFSLNLLQRPRACLKLFIRCNYEDSQNSYFAPFYKKPRAIGYTNFSFINTKRVVVKGGNGGSGCIAFQRLFCNPNGGPSGGDGGNGGHVIFKVDSQKMDLSHLNTLIQASNGANGHGSHCHGSNSKHLYLPVPVGTQIYSFTVQPFDKTADKVFTKPALLTTLNTEGDLFLAARGGAGGKGNAFLSQSLSIQDTFNRNKALRVAERGAQGESKQYLLRLSKLADLGFVGAPNAGKSTLLRSLTRARPKVAPYPFTTLKPNLGVAKFSNDALLDERKNGNQVFCESNKIGCEDDSNSFVVRIADLPGLIEGAALENKGLGIEFLNLISDCPVLAFVIDCGEPWSLMPDTVDKFDQLYEICVTQLTMLRSEVDYFDVNLLKQNSKVLVIGTKLDMILLDCDLSSLEATKLIFKLKELLFKAACQSKLFRQYDDGSLNDQHVTLVSAKRGDFILDLLAQIKSYVNVKDADK